jgi:hypothetical protein
MNPVVLTCALIIVGIGISLFGLYALIEKAVKYVYNHYFNASLAEAFSYSPTQKSNN